MDHLVELTNWVALLIEHLALGPPLIVGHSMGGGIAVDLAWRHPPATSGLVLLAPTGLPDMPPLVGQALQLGLDAFREPLRLFPQIMPAYMHAGPRRILRLAIDQTRYGQRQALGRLRRPILILRGSRDPIVTWELVDDILHEAHQAKYIEIPGAAHALQVSHPQLVAAYIRRFALEIAEEEISTAVR
jgi:pimeloyl-ACP methyl ester carboxylesterase